MLEKREVNTLYLRLHLYISLTCHINQGDKDHQTLMIFCNPYQSLP